MLPVPHYFMHDGLSKNNDPVLLCVVGLGTTADADGKSRDVVMAMVVMGG